MISVTFFCNICDLALESELISSTWLVHFPCSGDGTTVQPFELVTKDVCTSA